MRVVGIGAGGHAKVLMDIVRLTPTLELVGMLDALKDLWGSEHFGAPVLGDESSLPALRASGRVDAVFIGIGGVPSNERRRHAFRQAREAGLPIVNLVHPQAVLADSVRIGEGVMIMAGSVVNPDAVLGDGVIVNTRAVIEHDCRVGPFVHVCPGSVIGGGVTIGEESFIGIGSTIIQGLRVGARAIVGAGAVVVRDVPDDVMVLGCPARVVKGPPVLA